MSESQKGSDVAATTAMFAVILITRLTIASATDWRPAIGWGVSIVAGVLAAFVAWQLTRGRAGRQQTE